MFSHGISGHLEIFGTTLSYIIKEIFKTDFKNIDLKIHIETDYFCKKKESI